MSAYFFEILFFIINWLNGYSLAASNNLKQAAMNSFAKKNYSLSEKYLKLLSKVGKAEPASDLLLGQSLLLQKKYDEAQGVFEEKAKNATGNIAQEFENSLATIALLQRDTVLAILHLERSLALDYRNEKTRKNILYLKKTYRPELASQENSAETMPKQTKASIGALEENSEKTKFLERLDQLNMTEQQAKQIFEAIGREEKKHLMSLSKKNVKTPTDYSYW